MERECLPARKFECLNCKYADFRMSAREVDEIVPNECPRCGGDMKVAGKEPPDWLAESLELVSKHFDVTDFVGVGDRAELEVTSRNPKRSFRSLLGILKKRGYVPSMREHEGEVRLVVAKYPGIKRANVAINFILLGSTFLTTFAAGYFLLFGGSPFHAALFSGSIMLMLGAHELGHKIAAWRNGVESTLPYFIPAPTFLGTFGAVISIRSPIPTKEALVEMGASGPLLGFAVALPLTFIGLMLSPDPAGIVPTITPGIFALLQIGAFGYLPSGLKLNPLAFAGWVVMLLTMLNLIPAGQLDGGHVARGLVSRERHFTLTRILGFALFFSGMFIPEFPLWIWGFFIIFFFRGYHMGALDDVSGLSRRQKMLAITALIVFLLCLPVPAG